MGYKWGKKSLDLLATCDKRLQLIANELLDKCGFDLTVTCGYRGEKEQMEAYNSGKSKAKFGQSKHNVFPSEAIDIMPCSPINWDTKDYRWWKMVALAYEIARKNKIKIRSGAFFTGLCDCPHIELED